MVENDLELTCSIDDVLTYATVHNGSHIVRDIGIKNVSEADLDHLLVRISSNNELTEEFKLGIEKIKPGEKLHLKNLNVPVNAEYLASLTERSSCQLTVGVYSEEHLLASEVTNITAFAMPNHPVVTSMIQLAAKYLETWTGDPSLAGYQFDDPNRVKNMADAVLEQRLGTCMDMTLLYVACLEAMSLNPIMVMMRGHIFAGVWLVEESFPDMIMDDPSRMEKRMSRGIHEMTVVECTSMCAGRNKSFDDAVTSAERRISDYGRFAFVIDVKRARSMGIRPLPVRIKTDSGFEVHHEDRGMPAAVLPWWGQQKKG